MSKYVIRRDGRLYDTGYDSFTVAKINARLWSEEIGGLWQVFKLVKKGELEMFSSELNIESNYGKG